ncbi:MAG: bifunctional aspartate kinase/homoserine dehydrogenase I [Flavobacteriaceae bacterium]|nr:bifunctional aspartate kinase/homoserine dehydrogenase I [Flavobacteriaceae bacterium]
MKVIKFGGTSVSNAKSIDCVSEIIKKNKNNLTVVVSALGGITDILSMMIEKAGKGDKSFKNNINVIEERHLELIKNRIPVTKQSNIVSFVKTQLNNLENLLDSVFSLKEITLKSSATITSFGEVLSSSILFEILKSQEINVIHVDSRNLIETEKQNNREIVNIINTRNKVLDFFNKNNYKVTLIPGFIASDKNGEPTTLGRGGSDYTAALIANILDADVLEIWTDVSGMYTANPKLVSQAMPITNLSYYEAMELSHFGAKVIYPPTLQPIIEKQIPLIIKNTFKPDEQGTLITNFSNTNGQIVKGISHIDNVALVTLEGNGMIGIPGFSNRLFEAISKKNINIIMITQASSEYSICIGINNEDAEEAKNSIDDEFKFEISLSKVFPAKIEGDMVNLAIVGDKMKDHQGISGKLFSSLGSNNINIRAIAQGASERNISIIIDKINIKKALNTLHESFFESQIKELNLFVTGVGNVGGKLLEQIRQQEKYLSDNLHLKIRVMGLSNSKKMILSEKPIDLVGWKSYLESGIKADRTLFFDHIKSKNLRNSIFIDNTASELISKKYSNYLNNNIAVVTCNKIACADELKNYINLKSISRKFNSPFLFETNVGAGLPVIDTLNNLVASGDRILKIQAILSGSLNYIFNNFKKGKTFADVVRKAEELGYTEPDPKIDLSGTDVARKILILARESGLNIELSEIKNDSFLPNDSIAASTKEEFYNSLESNSNHFNKILLDAELKKCRLKYVAQLENGIASVGLQYINENHDFYNLEGSDNIILFYTNRYADQPLIVKGAGAGAEVTAAGIFADIIRIGKK